LLQQKRPLWIHGDGQNTRRYLYAGDAADAFDTILHKGEIGQTYNVDSRNEIANLDLAKKLLGMFGVTDIHKWVVHTRDRPFNDKRYAVDGTKLRKLGWKQSVSFEQGLAATVDWYSKFAGWWGNVDAILSPFPVVDSDHVLAAAEAEQDGAGKTTQRPAGASDGLLKPGNGQVSGERDDGEASAGAAAAADEGVKVCSNDVLPNGSLAHTRAKKRKVDHME